MSSMFRSLFNQSERTLLVINRNYAVIEANEKALALYGYTRDEMLARSLGDLMPPGLFNSDIHPLCDTPHGGPVKPVETTHLKKNGEQFPVAMSLNIVFHENEKVFLVAVRVLTARAPEERRDGDIDLSYDTLVSHAADGVGIVVDWKIVSINPAGLKIMGAAQFDEIRDMNIRELIHPDFRDQAMKRLQKIDEEHSMAERYVEKTISLTGRVQDIEVFAIPARYQNKKAIQFIFRDITSHMREQFDLQEKLQALYDSSPDFIVFKDGDNRWVEANKAAVEIFHLGDLNYRGKTDLDLVPLTELHKESLKKCAESDEEVWHQRRSIHVDEHVEQPGGGHKIFETIKTPLFAADGRRRGMIALGRDVTEHRKTETDLEQSLQSMRRMILAVIEVIINMTEIRDPYTSGHQRRVAKLATRIAEELQLPHHTIEGIRFASSIHDLGKIYVPGEILSKPGNISEAEFSLFKTHPRVGYDLLKVLDFPWPIGDIVLQHHERFDGSGYPAGLKGEHILMEARIIAVADVVESMSSHRPYRDSLGIEKALEEITLNRGVLYDPAIVDVCLDLFRNKQYVLDVETQK